MEPVIKILTKLIAEPFHAEQKAIVMSMADMERLKTEMSGGSVQTDECRIVEIDNVPIFQHPLCPVGKFYLVDASELPED